jgi:hypothetical protein
MTQYKMRGNAAQVLFYISNRPRRYVSCLMVENTGPLALHKLQQTWCKGVAVIPISLFQSPGGGWAEPRRTSTRLRDPQTRNALSSAPREGMMQSGGDDDA